MLIPDGVRLSVPQEGNVTTGSVQLVAAMMAAVNAAVWALASRWERAGHGVDLRTRLPPPPLVGRGADLVQVAPFVYPVLVAVAPGWTYEGPLSWSTDVYLGLQAVGLGLWALGIVCAVWAARAIGRYGAVSGVTVDHQLVSDGPYRFVRHPVYTAIIAVAVGTTLVFQSYLLLGLAGLSIATHLWWAVAEEKLLSSSDGLGEAYHTYAARTGRFLPRVGRARPPTGSR
ncbi:MAG TPA: isoprenylcysteine carboxylmethyltransferase family protein [Nocardioidaceae bacterium]|nr:isoprenylcysteine carboxylmethyltransferase family protein [Nocardioidaceae bacterium]